MKSGHRIIFVKCRVLVGLNALWWYRHWTARRVFICGGVCHVTARFGRDLGFVCYHQCKMRINNKNDLPNVIWWIVKCIPCKEENWAFLSPNCTNVSETRCSGKYWSIYWQDSYSGESYYVMYNSCTIKYDTMCNRKSFFNISTDSIWEVY